MRLSEAIRLGAALRPQCFGRHYGNGGSCALGAAYEAIGASERPGILPADWLRTVLSISNCPCLVCGRKMSGSLIPHLNDDHRWSRERIADLVELHEPDAMLPEICEASVPETAGRQK